jgi:lipopolysaccharide/colanic/teichoic acid biosynthesis glycosyltransferase
MAHKEYLSSQETVTVPAFEIQQTLRTGPSVSSAERIREPAPQPPLRKMLFDYTFATCLLIVMAIPVVCIALLIRIDSPGPVFFRQPRIGLNHQTFLIYKFRTMYDHGDPSSLDGSAQARRFDKRITRLGKWLRKYSIDELPQLFNVIRGEMSLVGPRPHPLNCHVDGRLFQDVVPDYPDRHRVLPGITGWAQVNGWRGETIVDEQIEQRVAYDLYYIENWSLALDLRIMLFTLSREILRGDAT